MKYNEEQITICWFSCGVTSTIATKIALRMFKSVRIIYIDTGGEHSDNVRFLNECQEWFGHHIEIWKSEKFDSPYDVWKSRHYLNSPYGAPCTLELKKKVRWRIEDVIKNWNAQVFGFDISEKKRAIRFNEQNRKAKAVFPLIERNLSKEDCMGLLRKVGIELPIMYRLGFHNNNCIGCVKGKKGYWSKIRKCFPETFNQVMELENEIGHSCMNGLFLKDLKDVNLPPLVESCSLFCDEDFMDI